MPYFFLLLLLFANPLLQGFTSEPALTSKEELFLKTAAGLGGAIGGAGAFGWLLAKGSHDYDSLKSELILASGVMPVGFIGLKTANHILAHLHGVSYRVEMVSRYYDIPVHISDEYRPLLIAAENKNRDFLRKVVIETFNKKFGNEWRRSAKFIFDDYLYVHFYSYMSDRKKEDFFAHIVILANAMAALHNNTNLYFNMKPIPSWKNMVDTAIDFYQFLGLIQRKYNNYE